MPLLILFYLYMTSPGNLHWFVNIYLLWVSMGGQFTKLSEEKACKVFTKNVNVRWKKFECYYGIANFSDIPGVTYFLEFMNSTITKKSSHFRCTYTQQMFLTRIIYSLVMFLNRTYTLTCTFIKLLIKGCRNVVAICKHGMNETEKGFVDRKIFLWCFDFFWSINCVLTFTNLTYSHSITNHTNEWCGKRTFFLYTWRMPWVRFSWIQTTLKTLLGLLLPLLTSNTLYWKHLT